MSLNNYKNRTLKTPRDLENLLIKINKAVKENPKQKGGKQTSQKRSKSLNSNSNSNSKLNKSSKTDKDDSNQKTNTSSTKTNSSEEHILVNEDNTKKSLFCKIKENIANNYKKVVISSFFISILLFISKIYIPYETKRVNDEINKIKWKFDNIYTEKQKDRFIMNIRKSALKDGFENFIEFVLKYNSSHINKLKDIHKKNKDNFVNVLKPLKMITTSFLKLFIHEGKSLSLKNINFISLGIFILNSYFFNKELKSFYETIIHYRTDIETVKKNLESKKLLESSLTHLNTAKANVAKVVKDRIIRTNNETNHTIKRLNEFKKNEKIIYLQFVSLFLPIVNFVGKTLFL